MAASTEHPARQFASDTYAGICPEAIHAIEAANVGHTPAYGDDPWTARATALLQAIFDTDCSVYFVATGTAANALALAAMCQSYHSVFCHADAHVQTDECGAPEYAARGIKLIPLAGRDGKLEADSIRLAAGRRRDIHSHQPGALSLSQATEAGTVYTRVEIQQLCATARELGLHAHMDGARFANAVAAGIEEPASLTWEAGIDILCLGGTKNGLTLGDAIVFFNRDLARNFDYRRKQAGHLLAKMRFLAAAWVGVLENGAWLRYAGHANAMARVLEKALRGITGIQIAYPVEANAVFVRMPELWASKMHERGWHFYTIAGAQRLMCSWDTTAEDIQHFVSDIRDVAGL